VIALGHQGLQEEIKLVPMDLADKPAWYKKVYPKYQVRLDSRYMQFTTVKEIYETITT
jgi:hypothetical protein